MHQLGDIIVTKDNQTLLVLAETDVIKEDMSEILQTLEPILITAPIRFSSFTKDGVLIIPQYSSIKKTDDCWVLQSSLYLSKRS